MFDQPPSVAEIHGSVGCVREERAKLLETVTRCGFIDDYSGIRISKSGRRFRISQATVWNLLTEENQPCGQAAMFEHWEFL